MRLAFGGDVWVLEPASDSVKECSIYSGTIIGMSEDNSRYLIQCEKQSGYQPPCVWRHVHQCYRTRGEARLAALHLSDSELSEETIRQILDESDNDSHSDRM